MIRLFVGLALPQDVREQLAVLGGGLHGARWIDPAQYHLTLRFIGEVPEDIADDIHESLTAIETPAFSIALGGMGSFGHGTRTHTLWVGVDRSDALLHLRERVDRAMVRTGCDPDTRKYAPHVSVAKLRATPMIKVQAFIAERNLFRCGPVAVDQFLLYSSHRGRSGATYTIEATYPLTPLAADR